jgi:predicted  nucleic acid-binding Zn-ribbon protein
MNDSDKQVKELSSEITRKQQQNKRKQTEKNELKEKRNSFLYKKEIQEIENDIQTITGETEILSKNLENKHKDAENVRTLSSITSSIAPASIGIVATDKESFIQSCDSLFQKIEEKVLKKYDGVYEYLSEEFLYEQLIKSLYFPWPERLINALLKEPIDTFNEFIKIKST